MTTLRTSLRSFLLGALNVAEAAFVPEAQLLLLHCCGCCNSQVRSPLLSLSLSLSQIIQCFTFGCTGTPKGINGRHSLRSNSLKKYYNLCKRFEINSSEDSRVKILHIKPNSESNLAKAAGVEPISRLALFPSAKEAGCRQAKNKKDNKCMSDLHLPHLIYSQ